MKAIQVSGDWFRAVSTRYRSNPLGFAHTFKAPSRYSAGKGRYPLLYLAPNRLTALLEYRALVRIPGRLGLLPTGLASSVVVFPVTVNLKTVIDLGNPDTRRQPVQGARRHSVQELTGDWRTYTLRQPSRPGAPVHSNWSTAPTQDLGASLSGLSCEAFLAPSAVHPQFCNLVVFPDCVTVSYNPLKIESVSPGGP